MPEILDGNHSTALDRCKIPDCLCPRPVDQDLCMSHLCLTPEESVGLMNEYYDLYMADVLSAADLRVIENLLGHRRPTRREAQREEIEGTNYDTQH